MYKKGLTVALTAEEVIYLYDFQQYSIFFK